MTTPDTNPDDPLTRREVAACLMGVAAGMGLALAIAGALGAFA